MRRDRAARRLCFEAAARAARALAPVGLDDDVADVAGVPLPAVEQAAVEHDAAADARRHDHADVVVLVARRARPALAERERLGVVVDDTGRPAVVARAAPATGTPRHAGMFSGDTVSPPRVIGPPQPTPTATHPSASRSSISRANVANSASGSLPDGVGASWRASNAPSEATTPADSFVPPTSTATTREVMAARYRRVASARDDLSVCQQLRRPRAALRRRQLATTSSASTRSSPTRAQLPYSLRILLENLLRREDGRNVTADDIRALADRSRAAQEAGHRELQFMPARVLHAGLHRRSGDRRSRGDARRAWSELGGDPSLVEPGIPVDLVIDHSIIADVAGVPDAFPRNAELEFERNRERYTFLRWAQPAFKTLRVFPPNRGICHQVNLEYLAQVVFRDGDGVAYPDTLVGTDSHTPMVNGLGVLGWGVGGIEAEAAMLGQSISMLLPRVVGIKLDRRAPAGRDRDRPRAHRRRDAARARRRRQVRRVLRRRRRPRPAREPGDDRQHVARVRLDVHDLSRRRRDAALPARDRPPRRPRRARRDVREGAGAVARPGRASGLRRDISCSTSDVEPSLAGPPAAGPRAVAREASSSSVARVPARRRGRSVSRAPTSLRSFPERSACPADGGALHRGRRGGRPKLIVAVRLRSPTGARSSSPTAHVVIAAITSCTNTSNPSVMIAAGLLAAESGRARADGSAVGEDVARARFARRHRLLRRVGPARAAREARLRRRRLRLHDVHRQLGPARAGDLERDHRGRPLGGVGALGQPQLRRPHPSRLPHELSRVAAARRRVHARGHDGHRPRQRSDRHDANGEPVYLRDLWPD